MTPRPDAAASRRPVSLQAIQRGAVLVVGLIFLALLTLIGVTAFSVATQEERMAGNARDRLRAFEAAEVALRQCEGLIAGPIPPSFSTAGTNGYYLTRQGDSELVTRSGFSWTSSPTITLEEVQRRQVELSGPQGSYVTTATLTDSPALAQQPRCVIEQLDGVPIPPSGQSIRAELPQSFGTAYRVTARAVGNNENTAVVLQSYFQRD
jgi:type IV pilus assembly protein PilX